MAYWGIGLAIGLVLLVVAPLLAHRWLKPDQLTSTAVQQSSMLMAFVLVFREGLVPSLGLLLAWLLGKGRGSSLGKGRTP